MNGPAALVAALDRLAERSDIRRPPVAGRWHFGARDLVVATGHPDGPAAITAALAPAAGGARPALELTEAEPADLRFLDGLGPAHLGPYGAVLALAQSDWSVLWEPGRRRLLALHQPSGRALFARGAPIPPREVAEANRALLHWAAVAAGNVAVHAGALAAAGRAVLVAGPGGAGKSTFTRAATAAGVLCLGDNMVEISGIGGRLEVHGVYASVKVRRPPAFPGELPPVQPSYDVEAHKDVYCFGSMAPTGFSGRFDLGALLVVTATAPPEVRSLARPAALFAFGPNTVAQHPLFEREVLERCASVVRAVPAFVTGHLASPDDHRRVVDEVLGILGAAGADR